MRVAIDIRSLLEGRHSGVQEYTQRIVETMVRVAPEHTYVAFGNAWRPEHVPSLPEPVEIAISRYPNKVWNGLQWAVNRPVWDRGLPNVDCVFVPSLRLVPLSPHVPLVSTWHDLSFERFPELLDRKRRTWHRMMRPRELAASSDHLIAVSEHTKQDLVEMYGVEEAKITVVYSGVGMAAGPASPGFPRATASARQGGSAGAPRGSPQPSHPSRISLPEKFILYLGTLEPRKNIGSIIRAFSAIAANIPHDLVLAGSPGWNMHEIGDALAKSAVRERIRFPGFIPEEQKPAVYAAADLFVYPSLYEGFGFPPLEALLAGTPVLTSFNSALPEVVGKWATLVNPYNVSELALVMKELLNDLPKVSEDVKQEILETYSWDRAAKTTLRVLRDVVK